MIVELKNYDLNLNQLKKLYSGWNVLTAHLLYSGCPFSKIIAGIEKYLETLTQIVDEKKYWFEHDESIDKLIDEDSLKHLEKEKWLAQDVIDSFRSVNWSKKREFRLYYETTSQLSETIDRYINKLHEAYNNLSDHHQLMQEKNISFMMDDSNNPSMDLSNIYRNRVYELLFFI